MKVLDLFSGIGGFSLGLERAGMETVAFCEIDPFCRRVLAKHWPEVPIHDDITQLDGRAYRGTVDVVCGGFPCQPFSHAGKRRGAGDDRHLWPEMLRVIQEVEPRFIIGENVAGLSSMVEWDRELDVDAGGGAVGSVGDVANRSGRYLLNWEILDALESLGYAVQSFVIPACAVDAHHRRDRVWILADRDRDREPDQSVHDETRGRPQAHGANANGIGPHRARVNVVGGGEPADRQERDAGSVREVLAGRGDAGERRAEDVADASGRRLGKSQGREIQQSRRAQAFSGGENVADSDSDGGERLQPRQPDAEGRPEQGERSAGPRRDGGRGRLAQSGMGGEPDGVSRWLDRSGWRDGSWEAGTPRVTTEASNRAARLKALGNAVVPQVVEQIGLAVMEAAA